MPTKTTYRMLVTKSYTVELSHEEFITEYGHAPTMRDILNFGGEYAKDDGDWGHALRHKDPMPRYDAEANQHCGGCWNTDVELIETDVVEVKSMRRSPQSY